MFKKKGPSGFKPKLPAARPRPLARPAPKAAPAPSVEPVASSVVEPVPAAREEPTSVDQSAQSHQASETLEDGSLPPAQPVPTPPVSTTSSVAQEKQRNHEPVQPSLDGRREDQSIEARKENTVTTPISRPVPSEPAPSPSPTPLVSAPETQLRSQQEAVATSATDIDNTAEPSAPPLKPAKRTKKRAATIESTNDSTSNDASAGPKKREERPTQDGDAAPKPKRTRRATTREPSAPRTRRPRSLTPEDAETQTVDLQKLKMADLTKDLHIGKKFSRHDELRERERQKKLRSKLNKLEGKADEGDSSAADRGDSEAPGAGAESAQPKSNSETPAPSATPSAPSQPAPAGPQFRIVDGQIVVDQESLAVDRHARAAAARAGEDMETIEENDFTRLITSNSFMNTSKLKGPNIWTDEETLLFYRGIAMFGTDFEIISKMIPGKTRRHVKLKFNREERHCPRRINAALIGEKTVAMDIDEYKAATGAEFETVEAINAEQQKIEDDYEAERKRIADEQAEAMRKKREELFAEEDVGGAAPKKKKGKKKKVEYGLNGEPIETDA